MNLPATAVSAAGDASQGEVIIEPRSGWQLLNLGELWKHRELLLFFTWRDVMIRYKQTALGAGWAVLQPLMMMVVFTVFLGRMAKVDSGNFAYPVFVYAGLLPWTFFATAITRAGNSVVGALNIVDKVYFPRLVFPLASVGAAIVDFLIASTILVGLMFFYGIVPGWSILLVPGLLALATLAALGVGTALAALNVAFRDFKYTIPFLMQLWMFATPTVYMNVETIAKPQPQATAPVRAESPAGDDGAPAAAPAADTEEQGRRPSLTVGIKSLLYLNPMTGLVAFFRAATLGGPLPWTSLGYSASIIVLMFIAGMLYFRRVECRFADII
jgi:lipopolysaccharide transport system permease protein